MFYFKKGQYSILSQEALDCVIDKLQNPKRPIKRVYY